MNLQIFDWVVPYHEGAVRYFREIGVWNDKLEAHNQALIRRQQVLTQAWQATIKAHPRDDAALERAWMKARVAALEAAGFDPVFR